MSGSATKQKGLVSGKSNLMVSKSGNTLFAVGLPPWVTIQGSLKAWNAKRWNGTSRLADYLSCEIGRRISRQRAYNLIHRDSEPSYSTAITCIQFLQDQGVNLL